MATNSIYHNIEINTDKQAKELLKAIKKSKKKSKGKNENETKY